MVFDKHDLLIIVISASGEKSTQGILSKEALKLLNSLELPMVVSLLEFF